MRIALLEDSPAISEYLQTLLEMEGHQVFPHPQGHSLLSALQTIGDVSLYDVIIIDLLIPNTLTGQDVMHHLQEQFAASPLPFIVVSAASWQELKSVQADFPETPIIRKPFKRQQLLEAIQEVVTRSKAPSPTSLDTQEIATTPEEQTP
jgi:DNA-binding response OmpR family regulator